MLRFTLTSLALCSGLIARADEPAPKSWAQPVTHSTKAKSNATDIVKTAATAGQFKTLLSLLIAADLDTTLRSEGPFTVFAPTDNAFAKLPKGTVETLLKPENKAMLTSILAYHVIAGKASFNFSASEKGESYDFKTVNGAKLAVKKVGHDFQVNDSKIVAQNVRCSNGSVQIIDTVLMPPTAETVSAKIPAIATKAGIFKTLLAAVKTAELVDVLNGDGPFTVFAPTDDAFGKLPEGTVESLLKPENREKLVAILKYHVISGAKSAKKLVTDESVKTLQSGSVKVTIEGGKIRANDATIIGTDIKADNGVIHIIDRVLLPK